MNNGNGARLDGRIRRSFVAVMAFALSVTLAVGGASTASAAEETQFSDVPSSAKFYTEIAWLADQQVTTGYSDGTFHPTESVSRMAFAAFLYRLAGKPSVSLPAKSPFKDVKTSDQFYKEIVWLSKTGITTGWSDGTFRPKDKITREAIAAFLYRFEGRPSFSQPSKSPFGDMTTRSKFYKEVTWLAKSGVTTGYSDGTFRPKINVSREAIGAFLYRGNTVLDRDGTYAVGSGVKAGTYTAVTSGDKYGLDYCYWERRDSNGDSFDGIIANDAVDHGRVVVTILSSDKFFALSGCSGLTPLRKVSPSATSIDDGQHAVGYHMKSGTYAAYGSTGDGWCYWETTSSFTGDWDDLVDNQYVEGRPAQVTLQSGQGFKTDGCGTWKRIGS